MNNKYFFNCTIILALLVLSGCETVKGTCVGVANGVSTGVQKDYKNTEKVVKEIGPKIEHADQWIQKNMW